jgi:riboflavin synthase
VFTGLVDDVGTIERIAPIAAGREFRIRCRYDDLEEGESIAVNGACLTVRGRGPHWFNAAAVVTTLGRTTMAEWRPGRRVNLERSIRAGDRFGGHMVQGHVDGVAHVTGVRAAGDARLIDLALPAGLADLMVRQGSIAVDGVSLTINDIPGPDVVQLSLIEYTLRHTALDTLGEGDDVHVEADMIGKYVQKMLGAYRSLAPDT